VGKKTLMQSIEKQEREYCGWTKSWRRYI